MKKNILILRETRKNETRVAITPFEVKALNDLGCRTFVERNAGEKSGYSDMDYEINGAKIIDRNSFYQDIQDIDIVLQVKRPQENIEAEIINNLSTKSVVIGFLDPQISSTNHIKQYAQKKITTFAWELLPQNIETASFDATAKMSRITGEIVVEDFNKTCQGGLQNKNVLVIGIGNAGLAAIKHAVDHKAFVTGVSTSKRYAKTLKSWGCDFIQLKSSDHNNSKSQNIEEYKQQINCLLLQAKSPFDVVICCARYRNHKAPILISSETINALKHKTVFYDLTASSGGNCENNQYGKTVTLGKSEIRSLTGYPQRKPQLSSSLYADCMVDFVSYLLSKNDNGSNDVRNLCLKSCLTHNGLINPIISETSKYSFFDYQVRQWSDSLVSGMVTKG